MHLSELVNGSLILELKRSPNVTHILEEVIAGDQGSYILKLHLDRTYANILTGLEISCQMVKLSFGELLMPA